MIEFKNYDLWDEVRIGPYIFRVEISADTSNYLLSGQNCARHEIFKYLRVEKSSYVKNIAGYEYGGGFPEVQTLEDLNKVIRQLQIDCLLKEAKEKYPVGVVFKSIFNKFNYTSSGKFEWIPEDKALRDVEVYGVIWHDNKWAEIITEEPKLPEINTYGLKVGDVLDEDMINAWSSCDKNFFQPNSGKWSKKDTVSFVGGRKIESFKVFNGIVGFLVSGTNEVYLKAEGFKEFAESFDKPKFEVGKWYKCKGYSYAIKYLREETHGSKYAIVYSDFISSDKEYKSYPEGRYVDGADWYELTDLSEIQKYLPEGHPDKINQNKLIPGKWYKVEGACEYIAKFVEIKDEYFLTPGYYIQDGKYILSLKYNNRLINIGNKVFTEVSIEEIQQYLPDDHPDKIKTDSEYIVGKWYKLGGWIAKFSKLKEDQFWYSMAGTPHDNYKHFGSGILSTREHGIPKLITDMTEVYKLFPEEKPKESEFEVNDWVVVESWYYAKIPLPQTCQISRIDSWGRAPYEILLNEDHYGEDQSWNFRKGEFRRATSEEVDREIERRQLVKGESLRITQIVKSVMGNDELIILKSSHADAIAFKDQQVPELTITIKTNKTNKLFINSIKTITL